MNNKITNESARVYKNARYTIRWNAPGDWQIVSGSEQETEEVMQSKKELPS